MQNYRCFSKACTCIIPAATGAESWSSAQGIVQLDLVLVETLDSRLIPGHGVFRSKISEFRHISIWKATDLGFRAEYGWLSKLGSRLGSFCIRVAYYFGELKRDPSLENYPYRSLRSETVRAVLYFIRRRQARESRDGAFISHFSIQATRITPQRPTKKPRGLMKTPCFPL